MDLFGFCHCIINRNRTKRYKMLYHEYTILTADFYLLFTCSSGFTEIVRFHHIDSFAIFYYVIKARQEITELPPCLDYGRLVKMRWCLFVFTSRCNSHNIHYHDYFVIKFGISFDWLGDKFFDRALGYDGEGLPCSSTLVWNFSCI